MNTQPPADNVFHRALSRLLAAAGALASVAHVAYHLGAIRQVLAAQLT